ncbi:HNH endonuclease signature motif containing protein [Amycolatopsis sp. RTGN1]|uniref:HNH endonuclease signature motif containing protein n=1 Tax=Amycolatopsis ponsaeliensis TaxID=2992142 RepID=UPI00254C0E02|nr:HNH endonuclease signature motif containing protein [Amycolatopsis sp. RTGN1]
MAETGQSAAWQLSDGELAAAICASEKTMRVAYMQHLELVAEADQRGLGPATGARDTAAFLVGSQRISWEDARARVAIATTDLPGVRAALAAGEIGPAHAVEIVKVLRQTPPTVSPEQVAAHEQTLLEPARQAIPSTVRKAGQRLLGYWDLDGTEPRDREEELARPRREFRYSWTRDGRMKFSGEFDSEAGQLAEGLFVPLARPDPADEHGNPDPRTMAERQGDAVAAIFDLAARAENLPVRAGERAVATVTIPYADLLRDAGLVSLDGGETLTVSQLRRLLCDAKVYPAVLGGDGQVLDLGRSARTATSAQRRALAIRDKGCTRPGCPRGPKWTTPHHVIFWAAQGGETNLDDLALVCERCHQLIHHGGWDIELRHGVVYWIPPEWLDRRRIPARNTAHDPPRRQAA